MRCPCPGPVWRAVPAFLLTLTLIAGCGVRPPAGALNPADATVTDCSPLYVVGDSEAATRPFALEAEEICQRFGVTPVLRHPNYMTHELYSFVARAQEGVDLVIMPPALLDRYVTPGLIQPIDRWIDEGDPWFTDILPIYRNLYMQYDGQYYGFAYDGDSHLLYYRKDLFAALDLAVPQNWSDYDKAAQALAARPGAERQYGTSMAVGNHMAYTWFAERYASLGGRYFDEQMRPAIDGSLGVQVLSDLVALQRSAAPEAAYDWTDLNQAFLAGTLPMVVQWSDTARFSYDRERWRSKVVDRVGWDLVPGGLPDAPRGGIWFGRILAITSASTQPETAAAVATYITGPEVSGRMVTRADTIHDPYRYSHFEHPVPSALFPDKATTDRFLATLYASLAHPMADLTIPGGWDYTTALDRAVNRAVRGEQSPAAALAQAAAEWERITEQHGRAAQLAAYQDWRRRLQGAGL